MTAPAEPLHDLLEELRQRAEALKFDAFGIASTDGLGSAGARLLEFIELKRYGDMEWMVETVKRRSDPRQLMPSARRVIMVGMSYAPDQNPLEALGRRLNAAISVYAKSRDYHEVLKGRLKELAGLLARRANADVKVFVDTAPLMEKPLAAIAGLGWQGKHTNLVSRQHGSWLFLGAILTDAPLPVNSPEEDHCGSCRKCLDICPTDAFPAPYQLDARRCIAYLTVEHNDHIPLEFRKPIGNRVFGCDDCLAVCPWNKFAGLAREAKLAARVETDNPPLLELLALDDAAFRARFAGTPIKRAGRERFLRNCLIAAGNSGDGSLLPAVSKLLDDPHPLLRSMAVWALGELATGFEFTEMLKRYGPSETDATTIAEWRRKDQSTGVMD